MTRKSAILLIAVIMLTFAMLNAKASYTIENLNVTVNFNTNTSAQVSEAYKVLISNTSVPQYETNRLALNLTLSDWQQLVGPVLVQHIINPSESLYNFKFLPGPIVTIGGQSTALIVMTYTVSNVTTVNETAPRQFIYKFNSKVFNFEHGASGEVLTPNTTLQMAVPQGAVIQSAYPIPDIPVYSFTDNYRNITKVSWLYAEPLSKFSFVFLERQSLQGEVLSFFESVYNFFGIFSYVIIAAVVVIFIAYTYYRASR